MLFNFTWGDRTDDGHGKWDHFVMEGDYDGLEIEKLMKAADEHFDFCGIAYDSNDNAIATETVFKLNEAGFDFHLEDPDSNFELYDNTFYVRYADGIEELILFMLKYIDPTLVLVPVFMCEIDTSIGYGMFHE